MSGMLTGQDSEGERPSISLTSENIEAISSAHSRVVISNALVRRSYDRVPFTENLLEKDLTDDDAPGDLEDLENLEDFTDARIYPEDRQLFKDRPSPSEPNPSRCPDTVRPQQNFDDATMALDQHKTPRQMRSLSRASHVLSSFPARGNSPDISEARRARSQPTGRRSRGPRSRSLNRPRKTPQDWNQVFGQESTTPRPPTEEECQAARAKADRLAKELHERWHNRADKNQKKNEIQRQEEIAAGGHIDPAVEQEISKIEKRKRGGVSKKSSAKPQEDEEEEDIDPQGWRRGEREETLVRMWGSAFRRDDEEEIDRKGNIISKKPATEPTVPSTWSERNLEEDVGSELQDSRNEPGKSDEDFSHLFEDSDDAPMPPPKKRRSAGGTWRG
ncbi:MAG: hypothetical protein Q9171_001546 [Xanthocarpia ochracea]